ncbi:MAG: 50S ribosomal protein L25 [Verrucomicrobia bacterium]|nr:50S ribosomal protein L25 [Verrucomicrobiota bacterium]
MKSVALNAFPRSLTRRPGAKRLRSAARIPAVIYGRQTQPLNLELKVKDFEDLLHHSVSEAILVDLSIDGEAAAKRLALVQEIQHHPLTGQVLHVDFHQVAEDEKVTVTLPVESVGEAAGVKTGGGILEHVLFKIKLRGLPKDLPEVIEVDVSHLELGQAIHLGEIKLPLGVEAIGDKGIPVIAVAAPLTEAQEAAALESATAPLAEPEVIGEKKEGAEETAPAGDKKTAAAAEKKPGAPAEKAAEKKPAAGKK